MCDGRTNNFTKDTIMARTGEMTFAQRMALMLTYRPLSGSTDIPGKDAAAKPSWLARIAAQVAAAQQRRKSADSAPSPSKAPTASAPATALARAVRPKPAPRPAPVDDDDELHTGSAAIVAARARERERMQAIVTSPAGQQHPALAQALAFHTTAPAHEALAILEAQPAAAARRQVVAPRSSLTPWLKEPQAPQQVDDWDSAFAFVRAEQTRSR